MLHIKHGRCCVSNKWASNTAPVCRVAHGTGVAFTDDREKTWFASESSSRSAPAWQDGGGTDAAFGPGNNLGKRAGTFCISVFRLSVPTATCR